MAKRILVTGGTGFIGSHTAVELQKSGYDVVIVDNLDNSFKEVLDGIAKITGIKPEFHKLDLTEKASLNGFFASQVRFDGVIHFAAHKAVGESVEKPLKYYSNNIMSLVNLLEVMLSTGTQNFVFSSSSTVYGQPDHLPVTEASPVQQPESPYGNTKKISEEIIADTVKSSKLKAVALRYFNPIGAHDSGLIGELPTGIPNNLIPYITQTAIGKRDVLTVYGNDYPTPDGTCIRDYIHVVDLGKAHVRALERMEGNLNKENFEVYNVGTGRGYSVLEVIKAFEAASGQKLNYRIGPRRAGDVIQIYADTSLANKELNWKAEETLHSMVASAWKWEQNIPSLFGDLLKA